jgi:hypothetical protein
MEFVEKAQVLLVENALYVGIGLFVAVLLAAVMWYYMSRGSSGSGSGSGSSVLANQARMNMVNTDVPSEANQPDPTSVASQPVTQEELEKQLASIGNMQGTNQGEEQPSD